MHSDEQYMTTELWQHSTRLWWIIIIRNLLHRHKSNKHLQKITCSNVVRLAWKGQQTTCRHVHLRQHRNAHAQTQSSLQAVINRNTETVCRWRVSRSSLSINRSENTGMARERVLQTEWCFGVNSANESQGWLNMTYAFHVLFYNLMSLFKGDKGKWRGGWKFWYFCKL